MRHTTLHYPLCSIGQDNKSPPHTSVRIASIYPTHLTPVCPIGIGLSIAHYLLSHSHKLVLISRTHSALDALHYQYGSERVEVLAGDMADASVARQAVELATSRWGRLNSVIVNHGTLGPVKKIGEGSVEEWKAAFETNVFGAVGLVSFQVPPFFVLRWSGPLIRSCIVSCRGERSTCRISFLLSSRSFVSLHMF